MGGGLDGSRGLDPSILEDSSDLSPSKLTLKLAVRIESSLPEAHSELLVASVAIVVEATVSVATVWLRGFLMTSEAFGGEGAPGTFGWGRTQRVNKHEFILPIPGNGDSRLNMIGLCYSESEISEHGVDSTPCLALEYVASTARVRDVMFVYAYYCTSTSLHMCSTIVYMYML